MNRRPPPAKIPKTADDIIADEVRAACAKAMIEWLKGSGINLQKPIRALKMQDFLSLAEAATSAWIVEYSKRVAQIEDPHRKKQMQNFLYAG